jgi:cyclophilin family peptidyl-prolyl cis-trans isomerase
MMVALPAIPKERSMNNRIAIVVGLFIGLLSGCSSSAQETAIRQMNELNKKTATAVAKAEDLADLKRLLNDYSEQRIEILKKGTERFEKEQKQILKQFQAKELSQNQAVERLKALEKDHLEFQENFEKKTKESRAKLEQAAEQAAEPLHKKLKEGPNPVVLMETSMGPIKIELYEKLAPVTVKNILQYVDDKFYDGTIFHRVIADFMIQGGGFEPGLTEKKTRDTIVNESYNLLRNERGTLAMARTPEPDSASAQFFISVKDNPALNRLKVGDGYGYTVFGKVIEGMEVVDKIREVPTTTKRDADGQPHQNVPRDDVMIKSVRRVEAKKG